jgi:hypothetical protein
MNKISGSFTITGGDEQTISDAEGEFRVTRVSGIQRFEGGIVGEGLVDWVMAYAPDRSARFVGFQHIVGSIGGRAGGFLMESTGFHDGRSSVGSWRIVRNSGTGALTGIAGQGTFEAPGGAVVSYELEYELV